MILDRHVIVERQSRVSRHLTNAVDPFIASDGDDPDTKWSRWCIGVAFGVYRKQCVLSRVLGCRIRKPTRVVATQPPIQFTKQLLISAAVASLPLRYETAPSLRTLVPMFQLDQSAHPLG